MMFCVLLYHTLLALQKNGSELYQTTLRQGLSYIVMWLNSFSYTDIYICFGLFILYGSI